MEEIFLTKQEDAEIYKWKKVSFACLNCGKISSKTLRTGRMRLLCSSCGRKETSLKKFGVECNLVLCSNPKKVWEEQKEEILAKRKETSLKKYGTDSPNQNEDVKKKQQENKQKNIKEIEEKNNCTLEKTLIKEYGQGWFSLNLPKIKINSNTFISNSFIEKIKNYQTSWDLTNFKSNKENEVKDFIKSIYTGEIIQSVRNLIPPQEIDIYIPEKQLAIEFNGNYWHSTNYKDKKYHINKSLLLKEKGIKLIHIFEYEWDQKKEIIKSIISNSLGVNEKKIFARKCEIRKVPKEEEKFFLEENHLQGFVNSSSNIGLYFNNELVEIATFGKSRFEQGRVELLRSCSKKGYQIIGGFSRLINRSGFKDIITYVDLSKFNGVSYYKSGFKYICNTEPSYIYFKDGNILSRYQTQKHLLKNLLENFNNEKTEEENMFANKYLKIYNCGNLKLEYKNEN